MNDSVSTVLDHRSDSSLSSDDNGTNPRRTRQFRRASAGNLLDSNGETDDEEMEKLHKTIQDQTKALTEEKQNSLKVILYALNFNTTLLSLFFLLTETWTPYSNLDTFKK